MRTRSRTVAVVLFDEVDLLSVTGFAHALSVAGRQWNWRPFRLVTVAAAPGAVSTRNQISVNAAAAFTDCLDPELIFVPGGYGARRIRTEDALASWLQRAAVQATHLLTVGAGAFPLAVAGLLTDQQIALAPDLGERLLELAPAVRALDTPGVLTSGRLSSVALPAASLDLGLFVVRSLLGNKQAAVVEAQLGYSPAQLVAPSVGVDVLDPSSR